MILAHPATRSLVIQSPDPFTLRDLIPDSRSLAHPDYNVAVKHTLEITKVLRNIGMSAPAPIRYDYDWPGKFHPYAHQIESAEFLTLHKRAFVLSEMGCVDATTEYLSPTGWQRIDAYTGGPVAQYHPDTGTAEFVEPDEYVKLPCAEMLRVKTKYGVDQLLSPEHRMLIQAKHSPGKREVVQAVSLLARQEQWIAGQHAVRAAGRVSWSQSAIPVTFGVAGGAGLPFTEAELRVQVVVIADGHFPSETSDRCTVRVKKQRKKTRLRLLLAAAGVEYAETSKDTATATGYTAFRFNAPRHVKVFDTAFWSATNRQLQVIADEVGHWDGSFRRAGGIAFSSYSKESADFVQYAFVTTGRVARLTVSTRERRGATETEYTVHARDSADPLMLQSRGSDGEKYRAITPEPSPDGFKYCFMVPSTFLVLRRNGCVFCTGNTGKTSSTLWAADWLMQHGHVQKALIMAPLSTLDRVWKNEIFDTLMHRVASVVHGTQEQRLAALDSDADFYILNHDGVAIKPVAEAIRRRPDIDLIIMDEASMFRNHDTKKYKAFSKMLRDDQRLWLLTGTPCPNAPTDAWALARLVNAKVPPYLGTFRRQTMMQLTQFKWVPRPEAYEIAYAAMQPAVRFRKKDCIDLPPVVTEERSCDMTTEQRKLFDAMRKEMQAEAKGMQINAVNAADKINKLRQILCGAVKDPVTGVYAAIPHERRLTTLLECIEQASAKVLVVVPFKGIIYELEKEVGKHYTVGVLNGDVSLNKRNEIIAAFKHSTDPHVLLCHPKVMSHGLNLTEADTLVFYAPIYSNDESQQVVERFNRPGQKNKMTVIRLGTHKLEWDIYRMVEGKRVTQESILDLYASITE